MSRLVLLEFHLNEEVTPAFLAQRVAQACGKFFALKPGERVVLRDPNDPRKGINFTVLGEASHLNYSELDLEGIE